MLVVRLIRGFVLLRHHSFVLVLVAFSQLGYSSVMLELGFFRLHIRFLLKSLHFILLKLPHRLFRNPSLPLTTPLIRGPLILLQNLSLFINDPSSRVVLLLGDEFFLHEAQFEEFWGRFELLGLVRILFS